MADAARLAQSRGPTPCAHGRAALATILAAGLALAPELARARALGPEQDDSATAEPDDGATAEQDDSATAEQDDGAPAEPDAPDATEDANAAEQDEVEASPAVEDDALHESADDEADDDREDADEDEDQGDDDTVPTEATTPPPAEVEPLRPLQTAAWWTMFGAFAVGTTAGVLSGLAERQEDRATRLSTLFDTQTGSQPLYADRKDEYEGHLRRGQAYANAALGVGIVAGVATITAITLFAVDAKRQRKTREKPRAALRLNAGGMEVRF